MVNYKELESFLNYLADKTNDVYAREVNRAIIRFLNERVTRISNDILK